MPFRRQDRPVAGPVEKADPQFGLHVGDGVADGRLHP